MLNATCFPYFEASLFYDFGGFHKFQFSAHGGQLYKIISLESSFNLIIWSPSAIVLYPRGT